MNAGRNKPPWGYHWGIAHDDNDRMSPNSGIAAENRGFRFLLASALLVWCALVAQGDTRCTPKHRRTQRRTRRTRGAPMQLHRTDSLTRTAHVAPVTFFFPLLFHAREQSALVVTGQSCTSHAGCTDQPNQYCDSGSNCYTCYFCINIYNDAIDGETSPVPSRPPTYDRCVRASKM